MKSHRVIIDIIWMTNEIFHFSEHLWQNWLVWTSEENRTVATVEYTKDDWKGGVEIQVDHSEHNDTRENDDSYASCFL